MVARYARRTRSLVALLALAVPLPLAAAQGSLSGTLFAPDVAGYVVIACLPDAVAGCDEAGSGVVEVAGSGPSAEWRIDGLTAGPFLLLAWRDADGDGEASDDELTVWLDGSGEPGLIPAPASGIALGPTAPPADAPLPPAPGASAAPARSGPTRSTGSTAPATPASPAAATALPTDLVGVWQMTRASAGDYREVATGRTFAMTSGFSTLLKLRPDGSFLYQFYSSGTTATCAFVSSLDTAVGTATWSPGQLVLAPTERRVEVSDCAASGTYDGGVEPLVFAAAVEESFDLYQLRTWTLRLDGGPVPLAYTLLDRAPLANPPVRAQPADFVLGDDPAYDELRGRWSPHPGSALDFYDPVANTYRIPEPDGTTPMWVRFGPDGYELARAVRDVHGTGVCRKALVHYERGHARFVVLEDVGGQGDHFRGHVALEPVDARVIAQVSECGPDDGVVANAAPLATSYFEWTWWRASANVPEVLSLRCPWPYAEYQGLYCEGSSGVVSLYRRE